MTGMPYHLRFIHCFQKQNEHLKILVDHNRLTFVFQFKQMDCYMSPVSSMDQDHVHAY